MLEEFRMGTNYYAKVRRPFPDVRDPLDAEGVRRLTNGWLCASTFYPDLESLKDGYRVSLHVGKSSMGLRFLLCQYPEHGLFCWKDWEEALGRDGSEIEDEYGCSVSLDELRDVVLRRACSGHAEDEFCDLTADADFC